MWKRIAFALGVVVPVDPPDPPVLKDFSQLKMLVLSQGIPGFTFQMGWKVLSGWLECNRDGVAPMFHRNGVMNGTRKYLPV